jgi:hypothetical protein
MALREIIDENLPAMADASEDLVQGVRHGQNGGV